VTHRAIEPRAARNRSINYVTARSRPVFTRSGVSQGAASANSPIHSRRGRLVPPKGEGRPPFRPVPFHQRNSVTHLSPFGCPETERKHRQDPAGMESAFERTSPHSLALSLSLCAPPRPSRAGDKPRRRRARHHVETLNSVVDAPAAPPDWIAIIDP